MKSRGFLLLTLLSFLLVLPLTSAVEVTMNPSFAQGETLLAVFSGSFVDQITTSNVHFYRYSSEVKVPISITHNVVKINNDFYVYATLDLNKAPGNYSISVEDVQYYKAQQVVQNDITSNFTITNDTAQFSISPGAAKTSADFSVELQNLQDNKITVSIDKDSSLVDSVSSIDINSGETKTVSFALKSDATLGLTEIIFSSGNTTYSLPVYLDVASQPANNATEQNFDMEFQPKDISVTLATGSDTKRILYLKNTGDATLNDISFNISSQIKPYVTVSSSTDSLEPDELAKIEIDISPSAAEKNITGRVTAYSENVDTSLTLSIDFLNDFVAAEPVAGENLDIASLCESDLGGVICDVSLECSGDIVQSKNGDCCVPPLACKEPEKSSSKAIFGWGLLVLAFIILIWFYRRKYKKVLPHKPAF